MAVQTQNVQSNKHGAKVARFLMPLKTQYVVGGKVLPPHQPRHYLPGGRLMKGKGTNPKTRLCGPTHDGGRP
ncbi:MAG: hypothetical protein LWX54_03100 [Deltaproteobacteria bacterium]|nr:hypothetical protein [Deltaproteobacteria bacterium]